jgi:virginiamycin B lyase
VITEFALQPPPGSPFASNGPFTITAGFDGSLWFAELFANQIGRITPQGVITEFPVQTPFSFPIGITAGFGRHLWFTELNGNNIGRITTEPAPEE